MTRELMKTISVSLTSSMCTALFVVACAAGATDSGKGGGSGDDGDGGDDFSGGDDGGLAGLISEVADMAVTIAAQQSSILALELEVGELKDHTFRWETYEGACTLGDSTNVIVDIEPGGVFTVQHHWREAGIWEGTSVNSIDSDAETYFEISCTSYADYVQKKRWRVAYEW